MKTSHKQHGVALITAILVVALATIAATSISANHQLSIRRTENAVFGSQAWAYIHGGESWVKIILARDLDDTDIDFEGESWATELPPLPLPGGFITGQISDEQGKININTLVNGDEVNEITRQRIQRLFSLLELNENLIQAIIDWIDPNINAIPPDGAEDDYYTRLDQPYLTANQQMSHISELRLVKGFDQETYDLVVPFLTALPENTAININTASATVIATLSDQIAITTAESLVEERQSEGFESLQEFVSNPLIEGRDISLEGLSTQSSYFNFASEVKIGNSFISVNSMINRLSTNNLNVISRTPSI